MVRASIGVKGCYLEKNHAVQNPAQVGLVKVEGAFAAEEVVAEGAEGDDAAGGGVEEGFEHSPDEEEASVDVVLDPAAAGVEELQGFLVVVDTDVHLRKCTYGRLFPMK